MNINVYRQSREHWSFGDRYTVTCDGKIWRDKTTDSLVMLIAKLAIGFAVDAPYHGAVSDLDLLFSMNGAPGRLWVLVVDGRFTGRIDFSEMIGAVIQLLLLGTTDRWLRSYGDWSEGREVELAGYLAAGCSQ